jgi:hypothetical protein
LNNLDKCKKERRYVINLFRSYNFISASSMCVGFFSLKCQNFASDLIQCYCSKCVCVSVYECLENYVCIHITYLSEMISLSITDENFIIQNWRAKSVSTSNMCQSSLCSSNYMCTTVTCYCLTLNGRTIFI